MTDLCHYTLTSGDIRRSPRSEVADEIVELVTPWCTPGRHPLPDAWPGYWLETSYPDPDTLAVTLYRAQTPIVVWSCCRTAAGVAAAEARLRGAGLWREGADVWAPACLVTVLPTYTGEDWAGDLERCLAWAWVEARDMQARGV